MNKFKLKKHTLETIKKIRELGNDYENNNSHWGKQKISFELKKIEQDLFDLWNDKFNSSLKIHRMIFIDKLDFETMEKELNSLLEFNKLDIKLFNSSQGF